jgi:hypothetical protein
MTEPAGSIMSTLTSDAILAWSVITGIGGLLGFASTGFLIYDRLLRYRPIVSVTAVRGLDGISQQAEPTLRVRNVAPFDLLIERFEVKPPYCGIASGSGIRDILEAVSGSDIPILLAPFEERELALVITVRDRSTVKDDEHIEITMYWRRSIAPWVPQWPVSVRTSLADIELRQKAAMNT